MLEEHKQQVNSPEKLKSDRPNPHDAERNQDVYTDALWTENPNSVSYAKMYEMNNWSFNQQQNFSFNMQKSAESMK